MIGRSIAYHYFKFRLPPTRSLSNSCRHIPLIYPVGRFFSNDSANTNSCTALDSEFKQLIPSLVDGCDYEHWLVLMDPPQGYPARDQIVHRCITTLALVLASEVEAKKSIYSVSTKYYYAFGCKVSETLAQKIRNLPSVRWVLPDSFLCPREAGYGGEPIVDGEVVPYDEKYHLDWLRDPYDDQNEKKKAGSRKARRKRKKK